MALLNDIFALIATTSLAIEIIVLFLLLYGYSLKRQLKFRRHGATMTAAVILHLITIFTIMAPSFVFAVFPEYIVPGISALISVVSLVHVVAGVSVASLGVWLVVSWRFRDVKGCFARKKFMRFTIVAWLLALSFGIILYTIFYWTILMG
jgi:uncharacterized membrane protein YozB (DUF420 family)